MDKRLTKEEIVRRAKEVHGDKYDYSEFLKDEFEYENKKQKIPIICHEKDEHGKEHGLFWQTISNHLAKSGCPKCAWKKIGVKRSKHKYLLEDGIQEFQ